MKKKDCGYTRKHLARYLAGHLFLPQRRRIERHLASCPVCSSELDAVRHVDETRRILRDITPPEGFARPLRAGTASVTALKRLLFRPVWLLLFVAAAVGAYIYVIHPLLHDPDLERLGTPVPPAAAPAAQPPQSPPPAAVPEPKKAAPSNPPAARATSPLTITITVEKEEERANIRRINEAMKEHALLRTMRFSDSVRELSGSLTAGELFTFFNRIEGAGKVSYKRSRLASAGEGELVPFVMRLQVSSAPARPAGPPAERPAEKTAEQQPVRTDAASSQTTTQGQ